MWIAIAWLAVATVLFYFTEIEVYDLDTGEVIDDDTLFSTFVKLCMCIAWPFGLLYFIANLCGIAVSSFITGWQTARAEREAERRDDDDV